MVLKVGTLCEVVGGDNHPSPNLGLIVSVASYQGEHTLHGPIYRCTHSEGSIINGLGMRCMAADFAEDWLKPLPEQKQNEQTEQYEVLTA